MSTYPHPHFLTASILSEATSAGVRSVPAAKLRHPLRRRDHQHALRPLTFLSFCPTT